MVYLGFGGKKIDVTPSGVAGINSASQSIATTQQLDREREEHEARQGVFQQEFDDSERARAAEEAAQQMAVARVDREARDALGDQAGPSNDPEAQARDAEFNQLREIAANLDEKGREQLYADFEMASQEKIKQGTIESVRGRINVAMRQGLLTLGEDETVQVNDGQGGLVDMPADQAFAEQLYQIAQEDPEGASDLLMDRMEETRKQRAADQVHEDSVEWANTQVTQMLAIPGVDHNRTSEARARQSEFETFGGDPEEFRQDILRIVHNIDSADDKLLAARMRRFSEVGGNAAAMELWDKEFMPKPPVPEVVVGEEGAIPQGEGAATEAPARRENVAVHDGSDPRFVDQDRRKRGETVDNSSSNVREWGTKKQTEMLTSLTTAIEQSSSKRIAKQKVAELLKGLKVPAKVRTAINEMIDRMEDDPAEFEPAGVQHTTPPGGRLGEQR